MWQRLIGEGSIYCALSLSIVRTLPPKFGVVSLLFMATVIK